MLQGDYPPPPPNWQSPQRTHEITIKLNYYLWILLWIAQPREGNISAWHTAALGSQLWCELGTRVNLSPKLPLAAAEFMLTQTGSRVEFCIDSHIATITPPVMGCNSWTGLCRFWLNLHDTPHLLAWDKSYSWPASVYVDNVIYIELNDSLSKTCEHVPQFYL